MTFGQRIWLNLLNLIPFRIQMLILIKLSHLLLLLQIADYVC